MFKKHTLIILSQMFSLSFIDQNSLLTEKLPLKFSYSLCKKTHAHIHRLAITHVHVFSLALDLRDLYHSYICQ